jgi:2-amino-4-hydroxy-6-hydroxymethyldihydropteridine diphosphokinase
MGDRERNLQTAIALLINELAPFLGSDVKESSILESEAVGFVSENTFFNQAITFKTSVSPTDLLKVCKHVEAKMGRPIEDPQYDGQGNRIYKSRIIDIDILLYGHHTIDLPELKIPHPRLQERDFALIPLREIFIHY